MAAESALLSTPVLRSVLRERSAPLLGVGRKLSTLVGLPASEEDGSGGGTRSTSRQDSSTSMNSEGVERVGPGRLTRG